MNTQLKVISRTIFGMFIALFFSVTMIQFVAADELRANPYNQRTQMNSYKIERGAILVDGEPVAFSVPTNDAYRFVRQYSAGEAFAPVTGYFSRTQGMTGLEQMMHQDLSGASDSQFFTRIVRTLTGEEPQGSSIETTLHAAAQQTAWQALAGLKGAAVAVNAETGEILVLASTPSYDPTLLSLNNDAEVIANYNQLLSDSTDPLINRAISGTLYHPGSTYKLLVAAAALESGAATPQTIFDNPVALALPGSTHQIKNNWNSPCGSQPHTTLLQAITLSCNVPIAELAMRMDRNAVPEMARAFGFEQKLSIPLEVTASVSPLPADKAQSAIASIGQLDVMVTPLQLAMVSAGIANDGVVMTPRLVERVIAPDLRTERKFEPEVFATPISRTTATTMQQLMESVVNSPEGSATGAQLAGATVGGKTGTAENGEDELGNPLPYTLWYTGYVVTDQAKFAVAVVVEEGGGEAYNFAGTSAELPVNIGVQIMEAVLHQ